MLAKPAHSSLWCVTGCQWWGFCSARLWRGVGITEGLRIYILSLAPVEAPVVALALLSG